VRDRLGQLRDVRGALAVEQPGERVEQEPGVVRPAQEGQGEQLAAAHDDDPSGAGVARRGKDAPVPCREAGHGGARHGQAPGPVEVQLLDAFGHRMTRQRVGGDGVGQEVAGRRRLADGDEVGVQGQPRHQIGQREGRGADRGSAEDQQVPPGCEMPPQQRHVSGRQRRLVPGGQREHQEIRAVQRVFLPAGVDRPDRHVAEVLAEHLGEVREVSQVLLLRGRGGVPAPRRDVPRTGVESIQNDVWHGQLPLDYRTRPPQGSAPPRRWRCGMCLEHRRGTASRPVPAAFPGRRTAVLEPARRHADRPTLDV
jgi:hypothetical protein